MIEGVVIGALAFVAYAYIFFPLLIFIRGWLFPRKWKQEDITPMVNIVIICHNEVADIERKLQNVLGLDYPKESLRIVVGSDGSDDGTDEIVGRYVDQGVTLYSFPRRGKIPALNDTVATTDGDILVFSDANSEFAPDALRKLVRHFADPKIGCVAGNQVYTSNPQSGSAAAGERSYWRYDRGLKLAESRAGNTISATGAIYAIRRELFQEVPSGVTDDFTISTRTILQGARIVFDPEAIAREPVAGKPRAEFKRKTRVMTRGLRAVWIVRGLLNPFRHGFYSLQLFSHKVLRRLVAFPLLLLLLMTPWLWMAGGWLQWLAVAQVGFYALALIGFLLSSTRLGRLRPFAIPYFFCLVNTAAIVAAINCCLGRKIERWESHRAEPTAVSSS
ncbi:MAG: glycosyltransferase family 2 protein [Gemmataceae bacterium]